MRAFIAALGMLFAVGVAAADRITSIEVRRLPPIPVNGASHELTLHLHTFRGTRWQPGEIMAALTQSAQLLAQCGVALTSADLRVLDAPRRFHYYHTPASRELLRAINAAKPAVFFVEDTRNNPAFDAEAVGLANAGGRPELANTVWVAHGARDLPYALAHELVHVLSNSGTHSDAPGNLMRSDTSPQNTHLTPAQCALMRSHGEANGLLRKRP